jgi:trigger factor
VELEKELWPLPPVPSAAPNADAIIDAVRVSAERIPESQVVLHIEVEPDQMERALDRAYRRLAQRAEIPGFRKGKAPRDMVERHLGRERLVHEALDSLIPEAYNKALDEQEIEAMTSLPDIVRDPLSSRRRSRPFTVRLGDYELAREAAVVVAQEDRPAVELRHRYALHEPVDGPSRWATCARTSAVA